MVRDDTGMNGGSRSGGGAQGHEVCKIRGEEAKAVAQRGSGDLGCSSIKLYTFFLFGDTIKGGKRTQTHFSSIVNNLYTIRFGL